MTAPRAGAGVWLREVEIRGDEFPRRDVYPFDLPLLQRRQVLRFETPIVPIEIDDTGEAIRRNTLAYNAELERLILVRPEQWYWVHRRWKAVTPRARRGRGGPARAG